MIERIWHLVDLAWVFVEDLAAGIASPLEPRAGELGL